MAAAAMAIVVGCGDDEGSGSTPSTGGTGGAAGASGQAGSAGTAGNAGEGGATGSRKLMLLYTSDEHSDMLGHSPELDDFPIPTTPGAGDIHGGIARRAKLLADVRAEAAAADVPTITVSAGDNAMGTLTEIVHDTASLEWRLMYRLGYDVTTLGNHDFDMSLPNLVGALDVAKAAGELPGIVSTNIHFSDESADDDALAAHYSTDPASDAAIKPYRVMEADNGLRVGFIGYIGVDAAWKANYNEPVEFSEAAVGSADKDKTDKVLPHLYADIQPVVDTLRNDENVDLVVALGHAGMIVGDPASEDDVIAANVAGIDVIISGHGHFTEEAPVVVPNAATGKDVLVLNGGANGAFVGRIELTIPDDPSESVTWNPANQGLMPVTDEIVADAEYATMVEETIEAIESTGDFDGQTALESMINRSLGTNVTNDPATVGDLYFYELATTSFDLSSGLPLILLTSDAYLRAVEALGHPVDLAMTTGALVRAPLLAGKTGVISVADAFRVAPLGKSPFDESIGNPLVRVKVPIGAVRLLFEFTSGRGELERTYNFAGSAIVAEYDCSRDPITSIAEAFVPSNGRVMKLWMDSDHTDGLEDFDTLVWDRDNAPAGAVLGGPTYIMAASMEAVAGLAGKGFPFTDMNDQPVEAEDAVVFRNDGNELKEVEVLFSFLHDHGTVPSLYDANSAEATSRFERLAYCP